MTFNRTRIYRLFETIPGAVLWATFAAGVVLSFIRPLWVVVFIICFSFYWLLRVIYFIVYLTVSWGHFRRDVIVEWRARIEEDFPDTWKRIHHLVFLPTVHEPLDVLRSTFDGIRRAAYPHDAFTVVLAGEERAGADAFRVRAATIVREFPEFRILITVHPKDIPGEVIGKGSNLRYAGEIAVADIARRGIPRERVIVSAFDVDTIVHPQYFSCLTWTFLRHPNRLRTSYQPVALYNNNIWESPAFMRVAAFGTTFWLFTELVRPDRLFTFSSHSMPLPALIDVGFWQRDIVTEDSRIFLQCFLRYQGDYTVTPLFVPVSMYTAKAGTLLRSMANLYKQQRRWAWGVEHFPYMLWHFIAGSGRAIPWRKKVKYLWNLGEGMYSWASAPIILFVFSRLPLMNLRGAAADTVLAATAPYVLQWILSIAMMGIFASAAMSLTLVPRRPQRLHPAVSLTFILQWLLLPVTLVCFGAVPAIEAQTRLMIGKYLGFYVAEKEK